MRSRLPLYAVVTLQFLTIFAASKETYAQSGTATFSVTEVRLTALNDQQANAMRQAIELFEIVMNDAQFRRDLAALEKVKPNVVITNRFRQYKVANSDDNRSLTAAQIVTRLLNGTEFFDPRDRNGQIIIDNEADISWRVRQAARCTVSNGRRRCNVRGSTPHKPSERRGTILDGDYYINTRSWFVEEIVTGEQDLFNLVEHLAHEWSHKFGFIDTGVSDKRQLFPYVFGGLVESAARRIAISRLFERR